MISRRALIGFGLVGGLMFAGGASLAVNYSSAVSQARRRVAGGSAIMPTRFGDIEYADQGRGEPLMMIHGAGGGFDQGIAFAHRFIKSRYRVIAPSRFGYLRSSIPDDPSPRNQADAFADLLDKLAISEAAVAGVSAGARSAIQFAIGYPERCTALVVIVPATYYPGQPERKVIGAAANALSDSAAAGFLFWLAMTVADDLMVKTALGTDPGVFAAASMQERERAMAIMRNVLPVRERAAGLRNDLRLTLLPEPLAVDQIAVPTLVIGLEDDLSGTINAARHLAQNVPGARLVSYPTGGHVWVGRDEAVFNEIDRFLRGL